MQPWLQNDNPPSGSEYLQSPAEAGRNVRVHSLYVLLYLLTFVLELGRVPWFSYLTAGLQVAF